MPNKQSGFSIIEILVVLLLISMFGSFVIPTFFGKKQDVVKKQFIADFTTLVQETLYLAITTKKVHQVFFNFDQGKVLIKEYDPSIQDPSIHKQFRLVTPDIASSTTKIPQQLQVKNFYIQNKDEIQSGTITHDSWFYIMPDGTSQAITINIEDQDPDKTTNNQFAISVNPFYSQVQSHDTFQKP